MDFKSEIMDCWTSPVKLYENIMAMCGYSRPHDSTKDMLNIITYVFLGLAVLEFFGLRSFPIPYGRHYIPKKFGPPIKAKLAWVTAHLPSLLVPMWLMVTSPVRVVSAGLINWLLLGMFVLHYAIKAIGHPFMIKKEHPMPLFPVLLASGYCALNGFLQAKYLLNYAHHDYDLFTGVRVFIGVCLFVAGMVINLQADWKLIKLSDAVKGHNAVAEPVKSQKEVVADAAGPGITEKPSLTIPHGGLFEYVSCANFMGEIVEWFGWFMVAGSLPALAHLAVSCGNLIPRALQHHRDYLNKFKEDYPKERKAIIPFVL